MLTLTTENYLILYYILYILILYYFILYVIFYMLEYMHCCYRTNLIYIMIT